MPSLKKLLTQYTAIGLYVFVIAVILPSIYLVVSSHKPQTARNVVLIIAEGLSFPLLGEAHHHRTEPMNLDRMPIFGVTSATSSYGWPPDRAAVATALATGRWGPPGHLNAPLPDDVLTTSHPTLLSIAREHGKPCALITNDPITTPMLAAFGASTADSENWNKILMEYLTYSKPEMVLGGGQWLVNSASRQTGALRTPVKLRELGVSEAEVQEQLSLPLLARKHGYMVVQSFSEFSAFLHSDRRVLGVFAPMAIPSQSPDASASSLDLPTLLSIALPYLERKPSRGFFLVVHDGSIRRAALSHTQDLSGDGQLGPEDAQRAFQVAIQRTLELDDLVRVVRKQAGGEDTLLIVTGAMDWCGLALSQEGGARQPHWMTTESTPMDVPLWAEGPGAEELRGYNSIRSLYRVAEEQLVRGSR